MSWDEFYSRTFQLDFEIYNKLACLALNQDCKGKLLETDDCKFLNDHLDLNESLKGVNPSEISRVQLEETFALIKQENELLYTLFNKVNDERKVLRDQNFGLLKKLFELSELDTATVDKSFLQFCNRSVFLIKELQAKLLERERDKNEKLLLLLREKDIFIAELHGEVQKLQGDIRSLKFMFKQSLTQDPAFMQILSGLNIPHSDDVDKDQNHKLLQDVIYQASDKLQRPSFAAEKRIASDPSGHIVSSPKISLCSQVSDSAENIREDDFGDSLKDKLLKKINELKERRELRIGTWNGTKSIKEGSSPLLEKTSSRMKLGSDIHSSETNSLLSLKLPEGQENLLDGKDASPQFSRFVTFDRHEIENMTTKESEGSLSHRSESKTTTAKSMLIDDHHLKREKPVSEHPGQTQAKTNPRKFPATTTNRGASKKFVFGDSSTPSNNHKDGFKKQISTPNNSSSIVSHFNSYGSGGVDAKNQSHVVRSSGKKYLTVVPPKSTKNASSHSNRLKTSNDESMLLNESVDLNSSCIQLDQPHHKRVGSQHISKSHLSKSSMNQTVSTQKQSVKIIGKKQTMQENMKISTPRAASNQLKDSQIHVSQFHTEELHEKKSILESPSNQNKLTEQELEEKRKQSELKKQLLREKLKAQCIEADNCPPEENLISQVQTVSPSGTQNEKWNKLKELLKKAHSDSIITPSE